MQNSNKKIKQMLKDSRLHSKKASDEIRTQGDMKVVERDLVASQQLNNAALRIVRKNISINESLKQGRKNLDTLRSSRTEALV